MYKIIYGDAFDILKKIPNNSIDLIVTDPPYDIPKVSRGGTINNIKKLNQSLQDLINYNMINGYDIEKYGQEFLRILKEPNLYFWCNKKQIPDYLDFYVTKHKCKFDILCWHKTNALPTYSNKYLSDTEYLLYFRKGKGKCFPKNYDDAKTYYIAPINHKDKKEFKHPTIKPLDITEKIIRNSSKENDIILDSFMGSGSTGVACIRNKRNFIGIEIEKIWYDLADKRLQKEYRSSNGDEIIC